MDILIPVLSFVEILCFTPMRSGLVTCPDAEVSLFELFTLVGGQSRTGPNAQRQTS